MEKGWLSLSLEQKVRQIAFYAGGVVLLAVMANVLVAFFGMTGFSSILKNNSQSLAFWSAMETECNAFNRYIQDKTTESLERYERAVRDSRRCLRALPFDYADVGSKRYAKTWSIRNMYENYERERDTLLTLDKRSEGYADRLYMLYRVQGYLSNQAGQLEQLTVQMGNDRYENRKSLLVVVPFLSALFGVVALWLVNRLRKTVNSHIVRPVVELAKDSARIAQNDFSAPDIQAEGDDEIASLVRSFCAMKASTKGYIETLKEKHEMERQLNAVRLQMLKNQINPHFLFNTLNLISSMAQIEDAATTDKMITALSRLFRYNLKSADSVMPLERELKIIQDYMYLQQMRFGKRIQYFTQCAPETGELLVPSFVLQPLVENSIKHGLSSKSQGGKIVVRSWMRGNRLWISVADTGLGISEARLFKLREALRRGDEDKTGIGIGNIYRRVHGMYEDGEMFLYSKEGCGTAVQLAFTPGQLKAI